MQLKQADIVAWEACLELAREAYRPHLPSRLFCVFGCPDLRSAIEFRDRCRGAETVYAAELLDPQTPVHFGSFDLLSNKKGQPLVDHYAQNAKDYWISAATGSIIEAVVGGTIRLLSAAD